MQNLNEAKNMALRAELMLQEKSNRFNGSRHHEDDSYNKVPIEGTKAT